MALLSALAVLSMATAASPAAIAAGGATALAAAGGATEPAASETVPAAAYRKLEARLAALEAAVQRAAAAAPPPPCTLAQIKLPAAPWAFSGHGRDIARNATAAFDAAQSGVARFGNFTTFGETGLYDAFISVTSSKPQASGYHFSCSATRGAPASAGCALTFEEPARAQGPGYVRLELGLNAKCEATSATAVGTYFFASETSHAGVYSFYLAAPSM